MEQDIGKRIKELRLSKKMTLKDISEKTNLSMSFLSQVERSLCSVTLLSLRKISEALGVSPSYFFPDTIQIEKDLIRRGNREPVEHKTSFVYADLSGNVKNPLFVPILVTLMPGDRREPPYSHEGQEFLYILEGILTVLLDYTEHDLHPGDSLHMDSARPHNWFNKTGKPVRFLYISSSPSQNS